MRTWSILFFVLPLLVLTYFSFSSSPPHSSRFWPVTIGVVDLHDPVCDTRGIHKLCFYVLMLNFHSRGSDLPPVVIISYC